MQPNEVSKTVVLEETQEQMEYCMDSKDPSILQAQNSKILVEDCISKVAKAKDQEKINSEDQEQTLNISTMPIQAERKSAREVGSGTPILEMAMKLKARKNLQGTAQNPFSILQNVDNDHLAKVAATCQIVLGDSAGKIDEFIDVIKAKEIAQAEITRLERAKEKEKEVVIMEECLEGHCVIVEELTKMDESVQEVPLPLKAGRGEKNSKIK